jgi:ornithine cyclodeaminase/alanine dehydrogenase
MLEKFNGSVSLMPSYLEETNALATKIISIYPDNPKKGLPTTVAWVVVNDTETGVLKGILDGTLLTALRTGAASGVAAKYLAPKDSKIASILGCGVQGRTQALAISEVFDLNEIKVFDLSEKMMNRFVKEMSSKLNIDVFKSESGEDAVKNADIVITATTSKHPVVKRKWLGDIVHVGAIGSFYPDYRELDTEIICEGKVVVDSLEAILEEAGDILIPISEGLFTIDQIHAELGDIINGKKEGRTPEDQITVFKSVGLAIQDSSVANLVLKKYRKKQ